MTNIVYRGSQSLLEVQGSGDTPETREQELSIIDEVPPIPVNPPQGLRAELGLVYLYNPDAANTLIKELNSKIGEVNQAVEDITSLVVNAVKVLSYSELNEPIAKDTPCYYEDCIYVAANNIDNKPEIFDPTQWVGVGTVDYNQLKNKPDFITKDDLSCTATGLTYNSSTGVLSLTGGYVIPTETAISDIETGLGTVATNLATEIAQRTADTNSANNRIDGVSRNLNTETNARTQADTALNNQIGAVSGSLISHTSNTNNPHEVTKAQVGLGNVNNTSDLNKPISTATQQALDTLNGRITAVNSNLTTNYRTAASQDIIDTQIRNGIAAVSENLTAEATTRAQADAALGQRITAVENVIPSAATQVNQLADKNYVNESVERMASSYITASASGNAFGNYARLVSGPWYYQGVEKTPDANDYAIVTTDEEHDDSTTRYTFDGTQWAFQYVINSAPMTQDQIDALNSTITKAKVDLYDAHVVNENNPHNVTKAQLGLGNVDNTSDLNKPISNDTLAALNLKANTADLGTAAYTDATAYATAAQGGKADTAVQPGDLANVATSGDYSDLINKPTTLSGYGITDGANTDLSNLTDTGKNISNWSSNVTNCITNIPQDIKLELDNGTLTLKAGSKVYVPNGAGVFDVRNITSDATLTDTSGANNVWLIAVSVSGGLLYRALANCTSGANATASSGFAYDTTANDIGWFTSDGTKTYSNVSFPICICSTSSSGFTSIDQIFNGFGYIGSTNFTLPGVKGLIPNGRDADGTLKSILYTVEHVGVYTQDVYKGTHCFSYSATTQYSGGDRGYYVVDSLPDISTVETWVRYYIPADNYIYCKQNNSDTVYTKEQEFVCGTIDFEINYVGQSIKKLNINTAFQVADINDIRKLVDRDLDNLTDTGKNVANWSSNVTNCITEIPQDINLTLSSGTLTLKAGSKVYVPNGAGVFATYTAQNDISSNSFAGSVTRFVFIDINNNTINAASAVFSGTTAPTLSGTGFWYDTTNNVIKRTTDSGATWTTGYSFPIAIVTSVNDVATSIDQVFNGFGYIGSTVFALPGVKGLIPDGRNADGTLKNTAFTVNNVITKTTSYDFNSQCALIMRDTGIDYVKLDYYLESETTPALKQYARLYQSTENQMYYGEASAWAKISAFNFGSMTIDSSGKITSFTPKTVFHAVDYSEAEYMAHQAMPSDRYIDLTLPASDETITAPADGYYNIVLNNSGSGWCNIKVNDNLLYAYSNSSGAYFNAFIAVSKGDTLVIQWADCIKNKLKFFYANGSK